MLGLQAPPQLWVWLWPVYVLLAFFILTNSSTFGHVTLSFKLRWCQYRLSTERQTSFGKETELKWPGQEHLNAQWQCWSSTLQGQVCQWMMRDFSSGQFNTLRRARCWGEWEWWAIVALESFSTSLNNWDSQLNHSAIHSLRTGGATTAANAKVPGSLFKRYGRWFSANSQGWLCERLWRPGWRYLGSWGCIFLLVYPSLWHYQVVIMNSQPTVVAQPVRTRVYSVHV